MLHSKIYPSKLLLFGEYLIVRGGSGLAIPFFDKGGQWKQNATGNQYNLHDLVVYLEQQQADGQLLCKLDLVQFTQDLADGFYFDSNIPTGFGMGSSGALVASIYDKYKTVDNYVDNQQLCGQLAQIESFFHGKSSGVDPLVSYTQQALALLPNKDILSHPIPTLHNEQYTFFLLNSNVARATAPLVDIFLDKCKDSNYIAQLNQSLRPASDNAIQTLLQGDWDTLFDAFRAISQAQALLFPEMILPNIATIWQKGLDSGDFYLKLCGAGGGGFYLGIAKQNTLDKYRELLGGLEVIGLGE